MRNLISICTAAASLLTAHAQLTSGCFTIGGPEYELARTVVQTSDGGYAFAGLTYSFSSNFSDENYYLVKTDALGNVQWNMGYGNGLDTEVAYDLIQTTDGGYAVGAVSSFDGMGLMKFDAAGALEWNMRYDTFGPDASDDLYAVVQTPDGGYLLAGSGQAAGSPLTLMVAIKTDAAGAIEWSKAYYDSFSFHEAYDVVVATSGGYALCGWHQGPDAGLRVLRINDSGDVIWGKRYGEGSELAHAMAATPDSGFVIAGRTRTYGFASSADEQDDGFVVKVDKDGDLDWARAFGGDSLSEEFLGIVPTSDGGYAMAGQAAVPPLGIGAPKMYVAKCDANGELLWSQKLATNFLTGQAWDIIECTDGGLVAAGAVNVSFDVQCGFMKMEADGTICPTCGAEPYGSDSAAVFTPVDLAITVYDNVATATLYTVDVFPGGTAVIGCLETSVEEITGAYGLLVVSPNPVIDNCTVLIGEAARYTSLELVNMQGATLLYVPVNGRSQVDIPLDRLVQGSYVLRTVGSTPAQHARLIVVR